MPHPKQEQVRHRYQFRCGYCSVTEESAGGELTIDHFQPTSAGGDDSDNNLVYACWRCNLHKSNYFPTAADISAGRWLLHPLRDDLTTHVLANEITGYLEARTETGRFHIETLHLNRPALVTHRQRQWLRSLSEEVMQMAIGENRRLRLLIADYETRLSQWEQRFGISENSDSTPNSRE